MKPELLILAAGLGSRYQGLKQLDGFGPNGETLMEYSLYDAWKAGFGRVVFVIQESFVETFTKKIQKPYSKWMEIDYVFQTLEDLPEGFILPAGRTKPWGTAHAVWVARNHLRAPFAVINSDDFYGSHSLALLADFLKKQALDGTDFLLVAYRLKQTLSEESSVNRGIVQTDGGHLLEIEERIGIHQTPEGLIQDDQDQTFSPDTAVSMNCWGFSLKILEMLDQGLNGFLHHHLAEPRAEFFLPQVVDQGVKENRIQVEVGQSPDRWIGVTHRADKEQAQKAILQLIELGQYPSPFI